MRSMDGLPFFSVIIPTFNRAHSIMDAVHSVLEQTFGDFELIVVDDGSTDNTRELLQPVLEKDARVRYVYQENAERSAARNNGIAQAKGHYICFLDSDDIYLPEHLAFFHRAIASSDEKMAMFVCSAAKNNTFIQKEPHPKTVVQGLESALVHSICSQQTCISRSILSDHQFDHTLRIAEDQELWSRILTHYPMIQTESTTVIIRDLGDRTISLSRLDAYEQNLKAKMQIIRNDIKGSISPELRKTMMSAAHYRLADSHLTNGNILRFYRHLIISIVLSPTIYRMEKIKKLFWLNP